MHYVKLSKYIIPCVITIRVKIVKYNYKKIFIFKEKCMDLSMDFNEKLHK